MLATVEAAAEVLTAEPDLWMPAPPELRLVSALAAEADRIAARRALACCLGLLVLVGAEPFGPGAANDALVRLLTALCAVLPMGAAVRAAARVMLEEVADWRTINRGREVPMS